MEFVIDQPPPKKKSANGIRPKKQKQKIHFLDVYACWELTYDLIWKPLLQMEQMNFARFRYTST